MPTLRLLLAAALAAPALQAPAPTVTCDYRFTAWPNGFMADLYITNHGPDISGWTARWTFNEPTANVTAWQANLSVRDGREAVATNAVYNGLIRNGQTLSFGWSATAASTSRPSDITVNGLPC